MQRTCKRFLWSRKGRKLKPRKQSPPDRRDIVCHLFMLETIWQFEIIKQATYIVMFLGCVWVVVKVKRNSAQTIYQSNSERTATNYMVKHVQDNNGKVMRHVKEKSGQTWEVRTPEGETSYYTTINTEDDE